MKRIIIVCYLLCLCCQIHSQSIKCSVSDSMNIASRVKADNVLCLFDSIPGEVLLYSIMDKEYYLIFKTKDSYKEYYVLTHNENKTEIKTVASIFNYDIDTKYSKKGFPKKQRRYMKLMKLQRKAVMNGFETGNYPSGYRTTFPNTTSLGESFSYFVMKDSNGNRHGECRFYGIMTPCPIDVNLWLYFNNQIISQNSRLHL